jgi:nucleotide-binding universal stress UspA family protein
VKKILVPCDGSEASLRAAAYAAGLAKLDPAITVVLLHVLDPVTFHSQAAALPPDDLSKLGPEPAMRRLASARALLQAEGLTPLIRCRLGAPASEIADEVAETGCDGVVMGTRGMRPLTSLMVGSVASQVVSSVSVPVTLVK